MNRQIIALALAGLALSGCFATTGGNETVADGSAIYEWERTTPDGEVCRARLVSSRQTSGGTVSIDGSDCSLAADAQSLSGSGLSDRLVERLIERAIP